MAHQGEYYLDITIDGQRIEDKSCTVKGHEGKHILQSWNWGQSNPGHNGVPSGQATNHHFSFALPFGQADAVWAQSLPLGSKVDKFELQCVATVEKGLKTYLKLLGTNGFIADHGMGASGGRPHTTVAINFAKFEMQSFLSEEGKAPTSPKTGSYDYQHGTA